MKNKFSKNELLEMINSGLTELSEEEIKELIAKELSKESSQIDTNYIDLCFNLLEEKEESKIIGTEKNKKLKLKNAAKILLIASIFVVIAISAITVSAQFNLNIPQKIAQLINGNAEIDYNLKNADTTAEGYALLDSNLAKHLSDYGINPVTFPEEMITDKCKIIKISDLTSNKNISKNIIIDFEYKSCKGTFSITQNADNFELGGNITVIDVISGHTEKVNGMDVIILEQKGNYATIRYKDNSTIYEIFMEGDLEAVEKLVKSIK